MNHIERTLNLLQGRIDEIRTNWESAEPFRYVAIDHFLDGDFAERILSDYPRVEDEGWDNTTYIHQRRKLARTRNFPPSAEDFFALANSRELRCLLGEITGIQDLMDDPELLGGGLHQILRGGFLDVHVDYNFHPRTKLHRRLNLLVYLNKDWKREYEGRLELWDMGKRRLLAEIAPDFNRAVIFETNETSYHGHPRPLNTPPGVTRKSLAVYYYTETRDGAEIAPEHNTLYRWTTGWQGLTRTTLAAALAAAERLRADGVAGLWRNLFERSKRKIYDLPPENK